MFKIIRINLLVFAGLLITLEVGGQLIALIKNKRFLFSDSNVNSRKVMFHEHPYLSVALNKNVETTFKKDEQYQSVKTTEWGTRWTGADLTDTTKIRIACLGGSTTFCTGVPDDESWPALLQKKLGDRYAVINFGVPAYKTSEAIIQLAFYVTELKPDFVIYYQGINDMYNFHKPQTYPDYFYHAEVIMPRALLGTKKYDPFFESIPRKSGIFYLIDNVREQFIKEEEIIRPEKPDPVVEGIFTRNLKTMMALSTAMGAKELQIGQVLNPYVDWPESIWSILLQREQVHSSMDRMNEMAKYVCENDSDCVYLDFKNDISWKPEHFWDEMHFTREGNELFSDKLTDIIKNQD